MITLSERTATRRAGKPVPSPAPIPRAAKPRGSLDDAIRAARDCPPCRAAAVEAARVRREGRRS